MHRTSSTEFSPLYQSEEPVHTQKSDLPATHRATPSRLRRASGTLLDSQVLCAFANNLF